MDSQVQTVDAACDAIRTTLLPALSAIRALAVLSQENTPTKVLPGFTVDEAQEEVFDNSVLALRSLEDAIMRVGKAKHVFLGDDVMVATPAAAATAAADTGDAGQGEGGEKAQEEGTSTGA